VSVLLDTHAAVWLMQADPRLGTNAAERLSHLKRDEMCICDLLLLEVSLLISKGRIVIDEPGPRFLQDFAARFHVLPIDAGIAALACELPLPHGDPFDRIFVATAKLHRLPLITRDRAIRESGVVETIW
jgi:PIN domain nuclease of toxin-antitoxin system